MLNPFSQLLSLRPKKPQAKVRLFAPTHPEPDVPTADFILPCAFSPPPPKQLTQLRGRTLGWFFLYFQGECQRRCGSRIFFLGAVGSRYGRLSRMFSKGGSPRTHQLGFDVQPTLALAMALTEGSTFRWSTHDPQPVFLGQGQNNRPTQPTLGVSTLVSFSDSWYPLLLAGNAPFPHFYMCRLPDVD